MFDFTIQKVDLSRILSRAASVAAVKSPIASLCCVLLDVSDSKVTARATDQYVAIETHAPASVKAPGAVAVDARKAADLVKRLPVGEVRVRVNKNHVEVAIGKSKFKLDFVDGDQFPVLPRLEPSTPRFSVEASEVTRLLAQGSYAMYPNESRPDQHATKFDVDDDGSLRVASIDGRRCAQAWTTVEGTAQAMQIPFAAVGELKRVCDSAKGQRVSFASLNGAMFVEAGDVTFSARQCDGTFPPYRKLVQETKHVVTLHRATLADALDRVAVMVPKTDDGAVDLTFASGELRISTDGDLGEDTVTCDANCELKLRVSHRCLSDAVKAMVDDEIKFSLSDGLGAIFVTQAVANDCLAIVMTMRGK